MSLPKVTIHNYIVNSIAISSTINQTSDHQQHHNRPIICRPLTGARSSSTTWKHKLLTCTPNPHTVANKMTHISPPNNRFPRANTFSWAKKQLQIDSPNFQRTQRTGVAFSSSSLNSFFCFIFNFYPIPNISVSQNFRFHFGDSLTISFFIFHFLTTISKIRLKLNIFFPKNENDDAAIRRRRPRCRQRVSSIIFLHIACSFNNCWIHSSDSNWFYNIIITVIIESF